VNRNGETGFIVNVGDISAFAEAIVMILSDPDMAQRMSFRGKEIADTEFSPRIIIPQYLNYYEQMLHT
jgi:glycosyltransferase involved in cell wall biosynthesis